MVLTLRKATFPPAPEVPAKAVHNALLLNSRLPAAWAGQSAWTILDNCFGAGQRLVATWQAWRADLLRPTLLHYVGHISQADYARHFSNVAPDRLEVRGDEADFYAVLHRAVAERAPGIHRILLERGQLSVTLCIGDSKAFLGDHRLYANTIWFTADSAHWDKWSAKALARACNRGAALLAQLPAAPNVEWLREAGFVDIRCDAADEILHANFNPTWSLGANEPPTDTTTTSSDGRHCCVVGAGISGASVAYALARRGWHVTVLEQSDRAANGASGLPVGLVVPHISADDSPRSRLSRVGARLMLQHATELLVNGEEWGLSGVHEHRFGDGPDRMHTQAAWVRPSALVKAWLSHPGIRVYYGAEVHTIIRSGAAWQVTDHIGATLARAEVLVFANAYGARSLLTGESLAPHRAPSLPLTLGDLQAVHGTATTGIMPKEQVSLDWQMPHNGHGCFIPLKAGTNAPFHATWLAGSSFEPDAEPSQESLKAHQLAPLHTQHAANLRRLQELLPDVAETLAVQFHGGTVKSWSGTRCVTHDRLPLAGPVDAQAQNGLWMHIGMGARGLTFSALGAELIAARICHEPWPVETSLARSIDAQRLRKRRAARQVESDSD